MYLKRLILFMFLPGSVVFANNSPDSCPTILAPHPEILDLSTKPPQIFLGEIETLFDLNQDLGRDWQTLKQVRTALEENKLPQAKRQLVEYLSSRKKLFAEPPQTLERRELVQSLSRQIVQLSSQLQHVPEPPPPQDGQGGSSQEQNQQSSQGQQSQNSQAQQSSSQDQNQQGSQGQQSQNSQSQQSSGQDQNQQSSQEQQSQNSQPQQSSNQDQNQQPSQGQQSQNSQPQQSSNQDQNQQPSQGQQSQNSQPQQSSSQDQNQQSSQGQQSQNSQSQQSSGQDQNQQSSQGQQSQNSQSQQSSGQDQNQQSSQGQQSQNSQAQQSSNQDQNQQSSQGQQSQSSQSQQSSGQEQSQQSSQGQQSQNSQSQQSQSSQSQPPSSQDSNQQSSQNSQSQNSKKNSKSASRDSKQKPLKRKDADKSDNSDDWDGKPGQSTDKYGHYSIEDQKIWKKILEGLGFDKKNFLDDVTKKKSPKKPVKDNLFGDYYKDKWQPPEFTERVPNRYDRRRPKPLFDFFSDPKRIDLDDQKVNNLAAAFVSKTLPHFIIRNAMASMQSGLSGIRQMQNLTATMKAENNEIYDELNQTNQEFFDLQEQVVFLSSQYDDLSTLSRKLGSLSGDLAPQLLNDLRTLHLLLAALKNRGELNHSEKRLADLLQVLIREIEPNVAQVASNAAQVGELFWGLLPGPLSEELFRNQFGGQIIDHAFFERIGQKFLTTSELDFYSLLIWLSPYVAANLREIDYPKLTPHPIFRRGPEDAIESGFLLADDLSQWPKVVESPYPPQYIPSLIESGELQAFTNLKRKEKPSPRRPKKKRSTIALLDVSQSMREGGAFAIRNILLALYLEFAFRPVINAGDEFVFVMINFDGQSHKPQYVTSFPEALRLLSEIQNRPPGDGNSTNFTRPLLAAFEILKKNRDTKSDTPSLNELSNILLITDGVDSSFRVESLIEQKNQILGADTSVQIDVFSVNEGNEEFADLSQLQTGASQDNMPLTYVHLDQKAVAHFLTPKLIQQLHNNQKWSGLSSEHKNLLIRKMAARSMRPHAFSFNDRAVISRSLASLAEEYSEKRSLLDATPPTWDDYLVTITDEHLREQVKKRLGPLVSSLKANLRPKFFNQAIEQLYRELADLTKASTN